MTTLREAMNWRELYLPGDADQSQVRLQIGEVGSTHPRALITAGVHGDEGPWGAWAIRNLLDATPLTHLVGSLRVVPCANPLAFAADARNAPLDTLDLNRSFPGSHDGSHTEVLAAVLAEEAVAGCDVVIDLHGGGSWCVNAFAFEMPGGEHLTAAFGAPFVTRAPDRTVTLTGYARSLGAAVTAVEMGGRSADEMRWANRIAAGLARALRAAGVLATVGETSNAPALPPAQPVGETIVLRPRQGGLFVPMVRQDQVGTVVPHGTELGCLFHPHTLEVLETFTAPFAQTALMLLRPHIARLEGGAMTYVVAAVLAE